MSPVGRPEIGQPINIRLGDKLLAAVDAEADRLGVSRAEVIRTGMIIMDTAIWARFNEVVAYADARSITVADAIRELVNKGLSHQ